MKDVITDFNFITSAGFHLEGIIRQIKKPRFLQFKDPSTLLSKTSSHWLFTSVRKGAEADLLSDP